MHAKLAVSGCKINKNTIAFQMKADHQQMWVFNYVPITLNFTP